MHKTVLQPFSGDQQIPKPLEKSGKHHHDGASGSSPYFYELNRETEESYQNPNDYPR